MKVPSKVDPCPIHEAVMEVRFDSGFPEEAIFGIIYQQLNADDFEQAISLPVISLPKDIRIAHPGLKYQPHYRLVSKNNDRILQIGPNVFSFAVTNTYPGWKSFLHDIKEMLERLNSSKTVKVITRMALRYLNFFEFDILSLSNLNFQLIGENQPINLLEKNMSFKIDIPEGEFNNTLTLNNNAIIQKEGVPISGTLIDIDTYFEAPIVDFFERCEELLEKCHSSEKKLFFSLLPDDTSKIFKIVEYGGTR